MRIALCLIVKGTKEEALLLDRCLSTLSEYVDGIFITRTQKSSAVGNVARNYNAVLSDYEWNNDFAAARNFNFAQVPKDYDYIMWSDADDVWRGMEKLEPTLKEHKHADGFGFWYLYEFDQFKLPVVAHRKTMIIKNDGCAKWEGALHEDLQPTRQVNIALIEGIERLHLTNDKRVKENALRNVEIAKKERNSDPRTAWNLANSQFAISDFEGARKSFEEFIRESHSNEEVYLARTRLANVYKALGKREECIQQLQSAIGLMPSQPDAYLQLAAYYYDFDNLQKAEEYGLIGIVKRPQIHKLIVFNPRDYDYNPMMLMAKIYTRLNRSHDALTFMKGCQRIYPKDKKLQEYVKEGEKDKALMAKVLKKVLKLQKIKDKKKLKAELDKLPDDMKSHPGICVIRNENFVKETSTGRDLAIYCGNTFEQWNPELAQTKMVGGSEEAVIYLSRELAKLGWNVIVYNNCGHKETYETITCKDTGAITGVEGAFCNVRVTYKPFWEFNYRDKQDVVIAWRWPKVLDAPINAPKIYLDLHDVVSEGEFTESRLKRVTKIFVKSKFHRSLFPNTPDDKFEIVPNGIEMHLDPTIKRDPYLMINTSSPDRSMDVLPKLFKEVKKQVPKAKLQWAYGWEGFVNAHSGDQKKMQWMEDMKKAMEDVGIESLGRLSQEEVGKLYQKASILAYPTEFAEIDCISVKKAQAAGCIPITTDFAALDESIQWGQKIHSKKNKDNWNRPYQFHFGLEGDTEQAQWVSAVIGKLKIGVSTPKVLTIDWSKIAQRWHGELCV